MKHFSVILVHLASFSAFTANADLVFSNDVPVASSCSATGGGRTFHRPCDSQGGIFTPLCDVQEVEFVDGSFSCEVISTSGCGCRYHLSEPEDLFDMYGFGMSFGECNPCTEDISTYVYPPLPPGSMSIMENLPDAPNCIEVNSLSRSGSCSAYGDVFTPECDVHEAVLDDGTLICQVSADECGCRHYFQRDDGYEFAYSYAYGDDCDAPCSDFEYSLDNIVDSLSDLPDNVITCNTMGTFGSSSNGRCNDDGQMFTSQCVVNEVEYSDGFFRCEFSASEECGCLRYIPMGSGDIAVIQGYTEDFFGCDPCSEYISRTAGTAAAHRHRHSANNNYYLQKNLDEFIGRAFLEQHNKKKERSDNDNN